VLDECREGEKLRKKAEMKIKHLLICEGKKREWLKEDWRWFRGKKEREKEKKTGVRIEWIWAGAVRRDLANWMKEKVKVRSERVDEVIKETQRILNETAREIWWRRCEEEFEKGGAKGAREERGERRDKEG
jgi:hypothetical protein